MRAPLMLSCLNDKQNMLLTQFSYYSHMLDDFKGMSIVEIRDKLSAMESELEIDTSNDIVGELYKNTDFYQAKQLFDEMVDSGLGNITVKDVENDKDTGFGAIAFTDELGSTGISYRGTDGLKFESLNDWLDNGAAYATGESLQSTQAERFYAKNRNKDGYNYLYGHSKGGELSEYVYSNNYDDIEGVHLLNPQPLNPYSLTEKQKEAMESDKVDIVIVEGDYVWFLGKLPSTGNIRIAKNVDGENTHLYDAITFDENGNIVKGEIPTWSYIGYSFFTTLQQIFWFPQDAARGIYSIAYESYKRVYDYIMGGDKPAAALFIVDITDKIKKKWSNCDEFAHELKEFLFDIADRVENWYNENFNTGHIYASENPQIKLDTYKLRSYAQRLQAVNRRVYNLDGRLDSLYWKVGLLDLWNLIQADLLTSYSFRLMTCASYLDETAGEFEAVETDLLKKL